MKRTALFSIFFLVGLTSLCFGQASTNDDAKVEVAKRAYSRIEPYVNNDTDFVCRIDLDVFNTETLFDTFDEIFVNALRENNFSRAHLNAANREFKKALDNLRTTLPNTQALPELFGVREVFVVVQNLESPAPKFFMPVAASKKDALIERVKDFFPMATWVSLKGGVGGVLDAKLAESSFAGFASQPNAGLKEFLTSSAGATIQVYSGRLKLQPALERMSASNGEFKSSLEKLPPTVTKGLQDFDSSFQEFNLAVDLNKLTLSYSLRFTTSAKTQSVQNGLNALVDHIVDAGYAEVKAASFMPENEANALTGQYDTHALTREILRGILHKLVPTRKDAVLSFAVTPDSKEILTHPCVLVVAATVVTPLLQSVLDVTIDDTHDVAPTTDKTDARANDSDDEFFGDDPE
ncbi:MAG: hypothetical protein Q4G03_03175 [Planctomycetia bacterium]|nr:hypothetical protein [Planctomycetia bacterium]